MIRSIPFFWKKGLRVSFSSYEATFAGSHDKKHMDFSESPPVLSYFSLYFFTDLGKIKNEEDYKTKKGRRDSEECWDGEIFKKGDWAG